MSLVISSCVTPLCKTFWQVGVQPIPPCAHGHAGGRQLSAILGLFKSSGLFVADPVPHAGLLGGWARPVSLFAISLLLAYLNYRGLTIVGRAALAMTAFIILTFVILCALSVPHLRPANWLVVDLGTVEWRPFINVMFW